MASDRPQKVAWQVRERPCIYCNIVTLNATHAGGLGNEAGGVGGARAERSDRSPGSGTGGLQRDAGWLGQAAARPLPEGANDRAPAGVGQADGGLQRPVSLAVAAGRGGSLHQSPAIGTAADRDLYGARLRDGDPALLYLYH